MNYPHLASRIFGAPLLIERHKLEVILGAIGPRIGIDADAFGAIRSVDTSAETAQAYGPGDAGRARKSYFVSEDGIAVIDIVGPLVKRNSGEFLSGGPTTYGEIENEFMDAATDPNIKGILLQIDSPGGESVGAFELSDLIHSQRGSKPIFAAADGDAFSAAYALASAADRLYVTKSGGVGSVGVWMMHVDQSAYNEKQGIKPTFVSAGARKLDGNPHEPLSDDARKTFQAEVDRIYNMFVDTVARNRSMAAADVRKTEAGLYFGADGVKVGFADQVGTMSDAMAALRQTIAAKASLRVAASAASQSTQEGKKMADTEKPKADAVETPPEEGKPEPKPPEQEEQQEAPAADANAIRSEALAYAAEVIDLSILAGMPKMAADFIKAGKPLAEIRSELQAARVAADSASEIHTSVLPSTGAANPRNVAQANINPKDSPIVKACEQLAQAGKD